MQNWWFSKQIRWRSDTLYPHPLLVSGKGRSLCHSRQPWLPLPFPWRQSDGRQQKGCRCWATHGMAGLAERTQTSVSKRCPSGHCRCGEHRQTTLPSNREYESGNARHPPRRFHHPAKSRPIPLAAWCIGRNRYPTDALWSHPCRTAAYRQLVTRQARLSRLVRAVSWRPSVALCPSRHRNQSPLSLGYLCWDYAHYITQEEFLIFIP